MTRKIRQIRQQFERVVRLARALATDPRIPKPLRWAIRLGLALKLMPFPDFGSDEIILGICAVLLLTIYRSRFNAVVDDVRSGWDKEITLRDEMYSPVDTTTLQELATAELYGSLAEEAAIR